jgi:hypothetical protein
MSVSIEGDEESGWGGTKEKEVVVDVIGRMEVE